MHLVQYLPNNLHCQPQRIDKHNWIVISIHIPIQPIAYRVFGYEASYRRVVVTCAEVDEAGFRIIVFAAVAERVAEVRDVGDAVPYKGYLMKGVSAVLHQLRRVHSRMHRIYQPIKAGDS